MINMNESAIACHEMYLSFIQAGFTEPQALTLVGQIIISGAHNDQI